MQEDFEEELHGFQGEQWGSVVANRLSREDYKKLTASEGGGGGIIRVIKNHRAEDQVNIIVTQPKSSDNADNAIQRINRYLAYK